MQIITHLDKILTEKGISVARFAEDSDIPPGRVYKWFDENKPASPKHEDVKKIEDWINKQVSRQEQPGMTYTRPIDTSDRGTTIALPLENNQLEQLRSEIFWLREQLADAVLANKELRAILASSLQKR